MWTDNACWQWSKECNYDVETANQQWINCFKRMNMSTSLKSEWLECHARAQVIKDLHLLEGDALTRRGRGLHHGDHNAVHVVFPQLLQLGPDRHSPDPLWIECGLANVRNEVEGAGILRTPSCARHHGLRVEEVHLPVYLGCSVRNLDAGKLQDLSSLVASRGPLHTESERCCNI